MITPVNIVVIHKIGLNMNNQNQLLSMKYELSGNDYKMLPDNIKPSIRISLAKYCNGNPIVVPKELYIPMMDILPPNKLIVFGEITPNDAKKKKNILDGNINFIENVGKYLYDNPHSILITTHLHSTLLLKSSITVNGIKSGFIVCSKHLIGVPRMHKVIKKKKRELPGRSKLSICN